MGNVKTSVPRLRSVRFKDGGAKLTVLNYHWRNDRKSIEKRIGGVMDEFFKDQTGAGGYAFVIWDKQAGSMSSVDVFVGSTVHKAGVAAFVHDVVLFNIGREWMRD